MIPMEASKRKTNVWYTTICGDVVPSSMKPKFKLGDRVRISKYKRTFEEGQKPNWTEEVFIIYGTIYSNPMAYILKELNGEDIEKTPWWIWPLVENTKKSSSILYTISNVHVNNPVLLV